MHGSHKSMRFGNISTSDREIFDILKAWAAVSIAFGIVLSTSLPDFYQKFIIASLTVGVGFLLHELSHKFVAQRYNCFAEFRSFDNMLILAIAMSFFGFVFAAPGAVMISGRVNTRKNGIISAAGPLTNIALAIAFIPLFFASSTFLQSMAFYGFMINAWLALFNMLPFWLFDGAKILKWSKPAYFAIVAAALFLMFFRHSFI
jgi:Zn-dependent protease